MRVSTTVMAALAVLAVGCLPHPAVAKFRGEYGCNSAEATALEDGAWRVEGCGLDATYVCAQAREGGSTLCVRERRDRGPARPSDGEAPAAHEVRLALGGDDDVARLAFAIEGEPALVFTRTGGPRVLVRPPSCDEASITGASGAVLEASRASDAADEAESEAPPADRDEEATGADAPDDAANADDATREDAAGARRQSPLGWPLSSLARFASEDALRFSLCGARVELRGTEMQVFRQFIARAGELR